MMFLHRRISSDGNSFFVDCLVSSPAIKTGSIGSKTALHFVGEFTVKTHGPGMMNKDQESEMRLLEMRY